MYALLLSACFTLVFMPLAHFTAPAARRKQSALALLLVTLVLLVMSSIVHPFSAERPRRLDITKTYRLDTNFTECRKVESRTTVTSPVTSWCYDERAAICSP